MRVQGIIGDGISPLNKLFFGPRDSFGRKASLQDLASMHHCSISAKINFTLSVRDGAAVSDVARILISHEFSTIKIINVLLGVGKKHEIFAEIASINPQKAAAILMDSFTMNEGKNGAVALSLLPREPEVLGDKRKLIKLVITELAIWAEETDLKNFIDFVRSEKKQNLYNEALCGLILGSLPEELR